MRKWSRRFARLGIATKGVMFFLLGFMAFVTACQLTNALKNEKEVLQWIHNLTFGWILLISVSLGLIGYIFSRFYLAFNNYDYDGSHSKPYVRRLGYFINGIGYCLLLFTCVTILLGTQGSSGSSIKIMTLNPDLSKIIVYIIAIGLIISAINEFWISCSKMMDNMTYARYLSPSNYKYLMLLGRIGRFSRGIVFATLAYILARSAYYDVPNLPSGADAAFAFITATSGAFIMGAVAFGVMCYGTFLVLSGKHRNIPIEK